MYLKTFLLVFFVHSVNVFAQAQKCAHLDVLFLVDESQSMLIHNGFENGKSFVTNVAQAFSAIPDARFAWVTFNSKVWQQTPFEAADTFTAAVKSTKFNTGSSDYLLGFNAAKESIDKYSKSDRETVVIFFSDGQLTHEESLTQISEVTKQIRCDQKTRIIGLGIDELAHSAENIRNIIGVNAGDSCSKAYYEGVPNFGSVPSEGVKIVQRLLDCNNF